MATKPTPFSPPTVFLNSLETRKWQKVSPVNLVSGDNIAGHGQVTNVEVGGDLVCVTLLSGKHIFPVESEVYAFTEGVKTVD